MKLLEREPFLAELDAALAEVNVGTGRLVLVSGEAGIGKTALVEAFTLSYQDKVRVMWGVCDLFFTPRPLGPLYDIAAQMSGNLPELLASNPPRDAIFRAVLSELQHQPVIMVFEDIHWADEATLDLLRFLGRRIQHTFALLVMTYRDDELSRHHPLRSLLGNLVSSSAMHRLHLPPLSENAVRTLIGNLGMDAAALHHQTGGNPFFVTEVLAGAGSDLPPTIRDAVLARTARLSMSGHAVLEAAAVIGQRIEPWLLAEVTGAEAHAVDESMATGILLAQGDLLAFRHELARQIILETISPQRKIVLHRLVLDTLKTSPVTRNDLARLAHHAEAARDSQAVLEFAPAAARQAVAASAHRAAATQYSLALRFAGDLPAAEHAQLLESYALECSSIDQRFLSVEMLRKALALWRELELPVRQATVLAHMANILVGLGRDQEARQCSQEAIEILEARPPGKELAHAYRVQAGLDMINHDLTDGIAWAEKSIALSERLQNPAEYYSAQNILWSIWMVLDYPRGSQHLEENLVAEEKAGLTGTAAHAYAQLGSISAEMRYFHQARRYLQAGIAYTAQYDLDRLWFYNHAWLAMTELYLGHWSEAEQAASIVLQNANPATVSHLMALIAMGRLFALRGDLQANALLDEALELSRSMGSLDRLGPVYAARAESAWLAGDLQRTLAEANEAYDLALAKQHPWYAADLAFWRWRAGEAVNVTGWMARPIILHITGNWSGAADGWAELGCPYEQAQAMADGDSQAQIAALNIFEKLGARPAAEAVRRKLQAEGAQRLPRKPRTSTRENPFNLTHRQLEILRLLTEGSSNAEIAARLHISEKTAGHHVSAILARLDVPTRKAAAKLAIQHPHFKKK